MDLNKSTIFSNPNTQRKTWEHLDSKDSDVKSLLLLNRVFRVGTDQTGQYLDIEPELRHAPLIISESGCSTKTKTVSSPREKLQDKLVLDGRRSPILNREDATRYRSACMRLSYSAQDRLDLAETAKHLAQLTRSQSSWPAILLAIQSRGRARRDWWLRLVTTL